VHREDDRTELSRYAPLYGGAGEIIFKDFFLKSSNLPIRFQIWTIPVDGVEGEHEHAGAEFLEEIYYVMSGEAEFQAGSRVYRLSAGDAVMAGPTDRHSIRNVGTQPLKMVVIYGRATGPHIPV
jgi:mannose-6-phosphate isomerase-like protein (cupin superfamily)